MTENATKTDGETATALERLWIAAAIHCATVCGEQIIDGETDEETGIPPMPDTLEGVLTAVSEYLEGTMY